MKFMIILIRLLKMDKIISIWKPSDITSFDVIRRIKKQIKGIKIGHCGTLDPFAEGILVICIGKYTKEVEKIMSYRKVYKAKLQLGLETDTLDPTGNIIKKNNSSIIINNKILNNVIKNFIGDIPQTPPYYSANKINGIKLYDFAGKDIFIRKHPKVVKIHSINVGSYTNNEINLTITCGRGTYIRALGRDIAYQLNTYGYIKSLQRLEVGEYTKNNSINLEDLDKCLANMS